MMDVVVSYEGDYDPSTSSHRRDQIRDRHTVRKCTWQPGKRELQKMIPFILCWGSRVCLSRPSLPGQRLAHFGKLKVIQDMQNLFFEPTPDNNDRVAIVT